MAKKTGSAKKFKDMPKGVKADPNAGLKGDLLKAKISNEKAKATKFTPLKALKPSQVKGKIETKNLAGAKLPKSKIITTVKKGK